MSENVKDMYWVICPKCSVRMFRVKSGEIEAVCSNKKCNSKWLITVFDDCFKYVAVNDEKIVNVR